MVVAQLVERFLLTAEVCGSNPVMGKIYVQFLLSTVLRRQNKEKRGREWPILKKIKSVFFW